MVTGQLIGTLSGRPLKIEAYGQQIVLRVENLRSAWQLRKSNTMSLLPFIKLLSHYRLKLRLEVGSLFAVNLFPDPPLALRLLLPSGLE